MESNERVSIIDMVKKAGVSITTVSKVVNQNGGRSKETGGQVRKTIKEYGFTPNVNTIDLRTNRSSSIGVIIPDTTNRFFARIIQELGTFLLGRHYSLLVYSFNEDYVLEDMHIKGLAEKHVDGIIYISRQNEIKEISEIKNLPIVYIDQVPKNAGALIFSDNETGGYLAGREPIAKGCTKIPFLRGIRCASTIRSRKEGFIRTLGESNISFSEELEMSCFPKYEGTRGMMERPLREEGRFFDETFTTNDMMALACVNVLMENRIKMPDQVRMVGFDNISLSQFASPQITTTAQDAEELALYIGETILKMIEGREIRKRKTIIPMRLIARETT